MTLLAILGGLFVLVVFLGTFALQALILLVQAAIVVGGFLLRGVALLVWCVVWVFNRKAAQDAWRRTHA